MPTYDYACRDCGHRFEAVQSIHDDALTTCPDCGGELRKVVGAVGIHFKGSGFYRTDSRKEAKGSKATGKTADSSPNTAKDDAAKAPAGDGAGSGKATEVGSSGSTDTSASGPSSSDAAGAKPAAKSSGSDTKK